MNIEKTNILKLPGVYTISKLHLNNRRYLAIASEERDQPAYIVNFETLNYEKLWNGLSGVMDIVQALDENRLFCITNFYPIYQSKEATICELIPSDDNVMVPWIISKVFKLPYCHRLGVITSGDRKFLIGSALCKGKNDKDDWSNPGSLWLSPIPSNGSEKWAFVEIYQGLFKNHGLCIEDNNQLYISSENGIMLFDFSNYLPGDAINPILISANPTSDIHFLKEKTNNFLATIEPFHGDTLNLYDFQEHQVTTLLKSYSISFGHVVWAGVVFGKAALIVGNRGNEKNLDLIFVDSNTILTIDVGVGPTQIEVYQDKKELKIFSANQNRGELSLYTLTQEE